MFSEIEKFQSLITPKIFNIFDWNLLCMFSSSFHREYFFFQFLSKFQNKARRRKTSCMMMISGNGNGNRNVLCVGLLSVASFLYFTGFLFSFHLYFPLSILLGTHYLCTKLILDCLRGLASPPLQWNALYCIICLIHISFSLSLSLLC